MLFICCNMKNNIIYLSPWYDKNVSNFSNTILFPDKTNDIEHKSKYKFNNQNFKFESFKSKEINNNNKINYKNINIKHSELDNLYTTNRFSISSVFTQKQKDIINKWGFLANDLYNFCVREYKNTKEKNTQIYNNIIDSQKIANFQNNINELYQNNKKTYDE